MASWRFTMGLRQSGRTATETYYHDASDLPGAGVQAAKLMNARNAMLFTSTEWVGIRIGLADSKRNAQLYIPGNYTANVDGITMKVPERGLLAYDKGKASADQPNSCIQITLRYGDTRSTRRYLSFVPDECVSGDPASVNLAANVPFSVGYNNMQDLLVDGGWAIRARLQAPPNDERPIQRWVQSDMAPNLIGAVIAKSGAPTLTNGDRVAIKAVRLKGTDKTSYNMIYRVATVVDDDNAGTRTVYLGQSMGGDPQKIKVLGTLQKVVFGPWPIQKWSWFRAGTHKRGGSFGLSRGRRSTRVLLDP